MKITKNKTQLISTLSLLLVIVAIASLGIHELNGGHAQSFTTEKARPANDFLNSVGVNIHPGSSSYANTSVMVSKLQELGMRFVRTNTGPTAATAINGDKAVVNAGIKLDFAEEFSQYRSYQGSYTARMLAMIKDNNFVNATIGVEGLNEPDNKGFNGGIANWAAVTCTNQVALYAGFHADPAARNIPIWAPPLMGAPNKGPDFLDGCPAVKADVGNMHAYPGGTPPEKNLAARIDQIKTYNKTGSKPMAMTETGYHTALKQTTTHNPIDEAGEAVYMPRLYLSYFAAGVDYTAHYELVDEGNDQTDREATFGLYHHDWSPKKTVAPISNMTKILADTTSAPTGSLTYNLSDTASVNHVLLQKSDGSYYLALWKEGMAGNVWGDGNGNPVPTPGTKDYTRNPAATSETISFPSNMTVATYMPNVSATPTESAVTAPSKTISLGPKVVILKISGPSAAAPVIDRSQQQASMADLVVTSVTPALVRTGSPVTFSAVVKNQGTAATTAGKVIGVNFKIDGKQVSYSDTNSASLAPGASVTLTANGGPANSAAWTPTAGAHSLSATVDDINRITESNKTNNTLTSTVTAITGTPDVVVTSIAPSGSSAITGTTAKFTAVVTNKGTAPTPAGTILGVSFKIDGKQVAWSDSDKASLDPGESVSLTANNGPNGNPAWTVTNGAHILLAEVDDINRITESNENNNSLASTMTGIAGKADLVVTAFTPVAAVKGDSVKFTATVKNQGNLATPAGTILGVSFKIDGKQVAWSDTYKASLAPGSSVTLTANNGPSGNAAWKATTGNHTLDAIVDDINRITESDENNNKLSNNLSVVAAASSGKKIGDINGDGHVNSLDLAILTSHDGQNYAPADLNRDGIVGAADLAILLSHWEG